MGDGVVQVHIGKLPLHPTDLKRDAVFSMKQTKSGGAINFDYNSTRLSSSCIRYQKDTLDYGTV